MLKHKITIHQTYTIEDPPEYSFPLNMNKTLPSNSHQNSNFWNTNTPSLQQSIVQPRMKSTYVLPILNMPSMQSMLFDSWQNALPEFQDYPIIEKKYEYIESLNIAVFKKFLFGHDFISINKSEKENLDDYLNMSVMNEDMIVHLDFLKSSKKLYANYKKFMKKSDNGLVYYFDETTPSVVEYKSSTSINSHKVFNDDTMQSYKVLHYYSELNILVNILMNPNPNKIIPTIVVSDLDGIPLEVHCYYKNKYIKADILNELKPNIISENFQDDGYFDKRDIDFLDMIMI
jgi:hypothetical protein